MKFLQTLTGRFINVEMIAAVDHELSEYRKLESYYSYLCLKDGTTHDFLEVPDQFELDDGRMRLFSVDFIMLWHQLALEYILSSSDKVIRIEDVMDRTWEVLMREIIRKEVEK